MGDAWTHRAWASALVSRFGVTRGEVYRDGLGSWGTYGPAGDGNAGQVHLGHYPTRARAMRVVAETVKKADKVHEDWRAKRCTTGT